MSSEMERLQALFAQFNKGGSTMRIEAPSYPPNRIPEVQDGYTVTRVVGDAFWMMNRPVGYHHSAHFTHTIKVVSWSQPDDFLLDLVDDEERVFHVERIFPDLEPDLAAHWADWLAYKRRRRKFFAVIDAQILAEHVRIAERW